MRLGLVGPAEGNDAALRDAANFLLAEQQAERIIYLGNDGALEQVVSAWAQEIVHDDPSEVALWIRAARHCSQAQAPQIDEFLRAERERTTLKALESLSSDGSRTVELLAGKLAVIIFDKAHLDEEDMLPATLLVFGKSQSQVTKAVGPRWFLSPGPLAQASGIMLLDDDGDGVRLSVFGSSHEQASSEVLPVGKAAKLKVSGG